jgi:uncharacterized protein YcnI
MQRISLAAAFAVALLSSTAIAHPSFTGPAFSNTSGQKVTFGLSHGCSGSDTTSIRIEIPSQITSVRPLYSDFGAFTVTRNTATPPQVTSITWTKTEPALAGDDAFYEFVFRARVADVPFSQLQLNVTQTCADGTIIPWDQPPGATSGEPAPLLTIVPPRTTGWNKITLATAIAESDLPLYFKDAQIVWKGNAAFSTNLVTTMLISTTTGVTPLTGGLSIGDEIWVKY